MHPPISVGSASKGLTGYFFIFAFQICLLILFGLLTDYHEDLLPGNEATKKTDTDSRMMKYSQFQDIHVMIFIGFAFLMTFLKKYGYSATGYNFLLGACLIQWAIIMRGCYSLKDGKIGISLANLYGADITVAAVLISMGALLGRTTPLQLLVMGIFEVAIFAANEYFQLDYLKIADAGGSITVHSFGAYFGLAVSFVLRPKKGENIAGPLEGPTYVSDIFAMVGSIFLWIYWPSFNSVLLDGQEQERAIINTYLSLAAATVTTFMLSVLVSHEKKFDMVHIQNSTLAGGVAVGACVNMLISPHGAILIGTCSGIISVLGYKYLSPALYSKFGLSDTCGVHNLHGMPAILSAVFSAFYAAVATEGKYKDQLYSVFPAMKNISMHTVNSTMMGNETASLNEIMAEEIEPIMGGYNRCAECQGGYQLLGIFSTVAIAIVSGLIVGLFIKSPSFKRLPKEKLHDDEEYWETPE